MDKFLCVWIIFYFIRLTNQDQEHSDTKRLSLNLKELWKERVENDLADSTLEETFSTNLISKMNVSEQ